MKKFNLLIISVLSLSTVYAQDITDALRYSQSNIQGTARFRALSGAFGALGGDLSAVSLNPAGSVVFSQSQIAVTGSNMNKKNETHYYNGLTYSNESCFGVNQVGAVFVFKNQNNYSAWKKTAISFNYERADNYNNNWYATGTNTDDDGNFSNSVASYFYDYANGQRLEDISAYPDETISQAYRDIGQFFGYGNQQAFLGYESYILDPEFNTDDNTVYFSNVAPGNFTHNYTYLATGYNGKMSFNFSTQYEDILSLGLNLNSHFINYERSTYLVENNSNTGSTVNQINFQNNLATSGAGFSFQLGAIIKITSDLRAGIVYNSPTWYSIDEETSQYIRTERNEAGNIITQVINPQIINVYPRYQLQSPAKFTGSIAYVIAKSGLISFDYSNQSFNRTQFKPTYDPDFSYQNSLINNNLANVSTYRVGAEYRIKQVSLRGGYRYEESPYRNEVTVSDLNGFSCGIGFDFGNTKLDLTYDQAKGSYQSNLYNLQGGGAPYALVDQKNQNISLTLAFNL